MTSQATSSKTGRVKEPQDPLVPIRLHKCSALFSSSIFSPEEESFLTNCYRNWVGHVRNEAFRASGSSAKPESTSRRDLDASVDAGTRILLSRIDVPSSWERKPEFARRTFDIWFGSLYTFASLRLTPKDEFTALIVNANRNRIILIGTNPALPFRFPAPPSLPSLPVPSKPTSSRVMDSLTQGHQPSPSVEPPSELFDDAHEPGDASHQAAGTIDHADASADASQARQPDHAPDLVQSQTPMHHATTPPGDGRPSLSPGQPGPSGRPGLFRPRVTVESVDDSGEGHRAHHAAEHGDPDSSDDDSSDGSHHRQNNDRGRDPDDRRPGRNRVPTPSPQPSIGVTMSQDQFAQLMEGILGRARPAPPERKPVDDVRKNFRQENIGWFQPQDHVKKLSDLDLTLEGSKTFYRDVYNFVDSLKRFANVSAAHELALPALIPGSLIGPAMMWYSTELADHERQWLMREEALGDWITKLIARFKLRKWKAEEFLESMSYGPHDVTKNSSVTFWAASVMRMAMHAEKYPEEHHQIVWRKMDTELTYGHLQPNPNWTNEDFLKHLEALFPGWYEHWSRVASHEKTLRSRASLPSLRHQQRVGSAGGGGGGNQGRRPADIRFMRIPSSASASRQPHSSHFRSGQASSSAESGRPSTSHESANAEGSSSRYAEKGTGKNYNKAQGTQFQGWSNQSPSSRTRRRYIPRSSASFEKGNIAFDETDVHIVEVENDPACIAYADAQLSNDDFIFLGVAEEPEQSDGSDKEETTNDE